MAKGRMINRKISVSERVNDLPGEAPLLFTWLVTFLDRNGRYSGNPSIVKGKIFPLRRANSRQIDKWLTLMEQSFNNENVPLIIRYEVAGKQILEMPGFIGEQIGLRWEREEDFYPPPPPDICRKICGITPDKCRQSSDPRARPLQQQQELQQQLPTGERELQQQQKPEPENSGGSGGRETGGGKIFELYEKFIEVPNDVICLNLEKYHTECDEEWIENAFKLMVEVKPEKPWRYVKAILDDWIEKGEMILRVKSDGNGNGFKKDITPSEYIAKYSHLTRKPEEAVKHG